jgi:4-hydroxybenzoate polyprenyltransferase
MVNYLKLLRPKHWIKNLLVFLPLVTAHELFNGALAARACLGAVMFCKLSTAVYVVNDMHDAESDRAHPAKRLRPLASGAVAVKNAVILLVCLLAGTAAIGLFALHANKGAWLVLIAYFAINLSYSSILKHFALADIFALASGYALRAYFCAAITGIEISQWLFLTLITGALFLALGKRRGELRAQGDGGGTRRVLAQYSETFLDKTMYMCEAMALVFYSLWSIDGFTIARNSSSCIIFTVPFVLLIFMRYNLIIERGTDADPVNTILGDKPLLALCGVFVAFFVAALYIFV